MPPAFVASLAAALERSAKLEAETAAAALEARGLSKTAELKKSAGKTWQSANDVDSSAAGGLGSLAGAAMRGPL